MIRLLFIRHGATAGNLEKRYIGSTDEALCEIGIEQMEQLQKQNFQIDRLFVSPMQRTHQSAEILFPHTAYTIVEDFRETDFGLFEGKTAAELSDMPAYQQWVDSGCLAPIPQGERVEDFKSRCCAAFEKILKTVPDNTCAAFVIHGGVIMSILEAYVSPKNDFYSYHIANGAYITALYEGTMITCVKQMVPENRISP